MSIGIGMGYVGAGAGATPAPILGNTSMFMVRDNAGAKSDDTDYFNVLMGVSSNEVTNIDRAYFVMPTAGTFTRFRVKFDATLTGVMSVEFYLVVNGSSTLLATVDSTGSTKTDDDVDIDVVKGDLVAYKIICRNSPTMNHYWLNMEFENATDMVIAGNNKDLHNDGAERYFAPQSSCNAMQQTNSAARVYFPTGGTLKNLYVRLSVAPGVGNGWQIKIIDQAFATKATINIVDEETTGEATITYALVQGNAYYISINPNVGTPTDCYFCYSSIFRPTLRGEYPVMYSEFDTASATVDEWNYLIGPKFYMDAATSPYPVQRMMPLRSGFVIKKWYVRASAPGAGKSKIMSIVQDVNTTILSATISDTSTTASDMTTEYITVEGEEYGLKHSPSGTPTVTGSTYAGFVLFK